MESIFSNFLKLALIVGVGVCPIQVCAENQSPVYIGLWHFHSSGGYKGYVAFDGMGGCSYFLSSAVLSIQATCVERNLMNGGLIIFGTQEGTNSTAPAYGDQLANPMQPNQPHASSTTVTFHVTNIQLDYMSGFLITPAARERIQFTR